MDWMASESADLSQDVEVDEQAGVIKNVALCGNQSRNGYQIPPSAFGDESNARSLYEGRHVYLSNHPSNLAESHRRPVELLAGYVRNVKLVNGRPRGDIIAEGLPRGRDLLSLVKARVPDVGLSHIAAYAYDRTGKIVEKIQHVLALDVVTHPATVSSFSEQTRVSDMADNNDKLLAKLESDIESLRSESESLKAKVRELTDNLTAEQSRLAEESKKIATLTAERDQLSAKVDEFESQSALTKRRQVMAEQLKKHKLEESDKKVCSEAFVGMLMRVEDDAEREKLIKDRAEALGSVVRGEAAVLSTERSESDSDEVDVDKILKSGALFRK